MYTIDDKKLNWKRILVILLFMSALSYAMGRMPNRENQVQEIVQEYDRHCPIVFDDSLRLDSLHLGRSRKLHYYISDISKATINLDTTKFVHVVRTTDALELSTTKITSLLNEGFSINVHIVHGDHTESLLVLDPKSVLAY